MNPKVIILAGGLGTRLKDVIGDLPNPLAPVGDRPFLEYIIKFISTQGFNDIIISCGHRAETFKDYFGHGSDLGLRITYTVEEDLLGTGGAIRFAEPLIDFGDFIVASGDTYFEVDLRDLMEFHKAREAIATIALVHKKDASRYGSVVMDDDNAITAFIEKSDEKEAGNINGGIYVFKREIFDYIPTDKVCSLETEILPLLIGKGLYGFPVDGYFIDIGVPEDYERAKKELPLRGILL